MGGGGGFKKIFRGNFFGKNIARVEVWGKGLQRLKEERDGQLKGSSRTEDNSVDVAKLAKYLGGGGHKKAAGFSLQGEIDIDGDNWKVIWLLMPRRTACPSKPWRSWEGIQFFLSLRVYLPEVGRRRGNLSFFMSFWIFCQLADQNLFNFFLPPFYSPNMLLQRHIALHQCPLCLVKAG